MKLLVLCSLLALSLTLAMATHSLVGEPPRLNTSQFPNIYTYENNSAGERQDLVLPCPVMDATDVSFQWFRVLPNEDRMVPVEMVDQTTGTLTVANITEGEYASTEGVNYYCVATRTIGKLSYTASVRSRTVTVFYALFGGFRRMTEEVVSIPVALRSDVALECDVQSSTRPPPRIRWLSNGAVIGEIIQSNKRRFLDDRRYLFISDLQPVDLMPTYRCEVTNALLDRTIPAPTTYRLIDNLTLGVLMDYKQIGDLTAFIGNTSFEFAYVGGVFGEGMGTVVNGTSNDLFRGPNNIVVSESVNIGTIAPIDSNIGTGTMVLRARVRYDSGNAERNGTLTVHQLPTITNRPTDNRELVFGMENLMYTCEFEGSDMPKIQWFFNGQPIDSNSGVSINNNNLMIASPQVSNSGIYQCIVSNQFSDDQAAWLLEIRPSIQPEMVPFNFTELGAFDDRDLGALIVQENGTTVNFFVDIMADPCPDITWFFNGNPLGASNDIFTYNDPCVGAMNGDSPRWRFTLDVLLTEATSGNYTANFTNIAGTTPLTRLAYFTVPAPVSVTGLTLSLPCLKEGQNVSLRCNINGFPRPTVMFSFNGNPITPGVGISIQQPFYDEITILNVNNSAEGLYRCSANLEGSDTTSATDSYDFCTVPSITEFTPTDNPVIGSSFTISCTATGIPQPDITWTKDGLTLEPTEDEVLRIVQIDNGRTSNVEVSVARRDFNGIYECIAMNPAGSVTQSTLIELLNNNQLPLSLGAIIGIAAGGVGAILLVALVILLLVCVYACGRQTRSGRYSAAYIGKDYTDDDRGNVDKESDEDEQPEAFNPQYESLPAHATRPAQPPSYKPTPSYPMGDDVEMKKVPLADSDSYLGGGGAYMQDNGMPYRPGVDDFLSEDAQFV